MPGLAGIVRMSSRNVDINALLAKMSQQMKHEDWYSIDTLVDESIGMARIGLRIFNPEPLPMFNEDKSLCIMMDGEIYDYQGLRDDLISKGHKLVVDNDPEFVLHFYEEYGKDFVHQLNGSYVLAIWDNKKQELLIANDRYGLRPLYYARHNGYLLFASEMKAILRDDSFQPVVDDRAVSDFLLFRCILGPKTFLRGISLLPAASIMICSANQISLENYWDFSFRENKEHSEGYCVQQLSKLVQQAVGRRLKGNHRIGASLTGGFDTRMIVANMVQECSPVHTYTQGGADCKDAKFAPIAAKKLGTNHHFFEYEPNDFLSPAQQETHWLAEIIDPDSFGIINKLKEIKTFLNVELTGIGGGEIFRGNHLTKQMEASKNEGELFKAVYRYLSLDIPYELFDDHWYEEIQGVSRDYLKFLFRKYSDRPLLNKSDHFLIREILPSYVRSDFMIKNSQFEYRAPYFDYELVDFIQTVPVSFRKDSHIMIKVFLKLFPDLAKVSFEAAGCPVYINRFQAIMQKLKGKFGGIIRRLPAVHFRNYRLVDYSRWLRENAQVQEYVKGILLSKGARSRPYFKPEAIQRMLEDQFAGRKDNWKLVTRLIILELWHRIFLNDDNKG